MNYWNWTQEPDDDKTLTGKIRQRIIDAYEYHRNPVGFWRRFSAVVYMVMSFAALLNLVTLDLGDFAVDVAIIAAFVWLDSSTYRRDRAKLPA